MNEVYITPEIEVIMLDVYDDVITTSGSIVDGDGWINAGGDLGGGEGADKSDW